MPFRGAGNCDAHHESEAIALFSGIYRKDLRFSSCALYWRTFCIDPTCPNDSALSD